MMSRKQGFRARAVLVAASLAAVVIGIAGAPAMAAQDDYEGWFLALDFASTQPTGLDQQYATYLDATTFFGTRQVIDNDADFTWGAKIGYSWGALGGLAVSYWSFDNEDKVEEGVTGSYVYPNVFGSYGYNNGSSYGLGFAYPGSGYGFPVSVQATSKVQASTIDIDYFRPMQAGENLTIKWIAGLRSATFEEDRSFDGIDAYGYYSREMKHLESDAFGVKLGATAIFGFTDHFSLQGGVAFSLLQGDNEAAARRDADFGFLGGAARDEVSSEDNNSRGEIRDYDLRAVWTWDRFDFWVGYGGQTWEGLVEDPLNGSCCASSGADTSQRDSIAFNKAHAGVAIRFGGD